MASRRELEALIVLAGRVSPSLQSALRQTQRGIGSIDSSSTLMGKTMNKAFSLASKTVAVGAAAVGAGLAYIGNKGLQAASDLTEVQNVVDVTFGQNAKVIDEWSKAALKSYGLSELGAKKYSSTIGAMLKSSGLTSGSVLTMSENLTALSGDFSSFYNIAQDDAFTKIRAGISGETEPLKQLGINMSVANMEAYALSKGIKTAYKDMDQATQTTLRYNYLLSVSKDAQGDFARTQGSFSNQVKLAKSNLEQLSSKIMTAAIPGFTKLVQIGNKLMDGAMGNPEFIQKFQDTLTRAMDKANELLPKVGGFLEQLWSRLLTLYDISMKVFDFIYNNWPLIEPVVWGIVAAQIAFNAAARAALIIEAVSKAYAVANTMIRIYKSGIGLASVAQWALNAAWAASPIGMITVGIGLLVAAGVLLYKNWDTLAKFADVVWDKIKSAFSDGVNLVGGKINSLIEKLNKIPGVNIPLIPTVGKTQGTMAEFNQKSATLNSSIPQFAKGGFTNQPSIFGEAGPEAAIPLKYKNPRSLSILNQTAKAIGADKTGSSPIPNISLTFNFNGPVNNKDDVSRGVESAGDYIRKVVEDLFAEKERVSFG